MSGDRETWDRLAAAGLVQGDPPPVPLDSPWYVRLMLGFAGWIAALFLLGFVAAGLSWVIESQAASIVTGLLLMGIAWLLFSRLGRNDFATQFALAVSFAGQALFASGVFGWSGSEPGSSFAWLWFTLLQVLLLLVMPNPVHRLWSGFAAAATGYATLREFDLGFLGPPLMLAAAAWLWLNEFRWPRGGAVLRPAAYGLVMALILTELAAGWLRPAVGASLGLDPQARVYDLAGQVLSGAVLLATVWVLLHRAGSTWARKSFAAALAGTLVVILVSLEAPGIAAGLCILLLGYAHGNTALAALGGLALLLYAGGYYYEMDTTLLVKAEVMAATGALLLLIRWVLPRVFEPGGERG